MPRQPKPPLSVSAHTHPDAARKHIPTAEYQALLDAEAQAPIAVAYARRNPDLDPQLVWRGKDMQDWSDLMVQAAPLYIQEKVHPKALVDDLMRLSAADAKAQQAQIDLFADFNGLPTEAAKTEFYQHDAHWANRLILGDSLQVMASLAEREGLRGKVQCLYFDPPYGIKFNSNFQWSTTSRDVKDGNPAHITRDPEQVKAFRDTWRDGIHSYLTYLRDRLTVARDLLTDSGSIFVQIGDENVHRVRAVMDEVFGDENFFSQITLKKLSPLGTGGMANVTDYVLWYAKSKAQIKFRPIFDSKAKGSESRYDYVELPSGERRKLTAEEEENLETLPKNWKLYSAQGMLSSGYTPTCTFDFELYGRTIYKNKKSWRTNRKGIDVLTKANRLVIHGSLPYLVAYHDDNPLSTMSNIWTDSGSASTSYEKIYVVQTSTRQIQKCLLMATDPGDLVLDPTCGSGTTAYVAEQWGRRWITIDTSRVALALARARLMGARYPYYLLKDSREGQLKEAELARTVPSSQPVYGNLRQGFVYERVPHITLKAIANNTEIDVIWAQWEGELEEIRGKINEVIREWGMGKAGKAGKEGKEGREGKAGKKQEAFRPLADWEIPRQPLPDWPPETQLLITNYWSLRLARQKAIDAAIAAQAEYEYLYDKPYSDNKKVRVAGPFTVESLSPHRTLGVDENDELLDSAAGRHQAAVYDFATIILENLRIAGVQQAHKQDKITFTALTPWPGHYICAEGRFLPSPAAPPSGGRGAGGEVRAAIFIGPEFGTVTRPDLVEAAREAAEGGFAVLIACAFSYDAHSTEFTKLGRLPVLKARMNADLHMATDLQTTDKANLFVIFGEPDIDLQPQPDGLFRVLLRGVDVYHPNLGEIRSSNADGIACWFIDTDYNQESFFVRHAYFLGAGDPYSALKTTLKAEVNPDAWATLNSDLSRPFPKPKSGRIAVKVINHLGDEVMKVFKV